MNDAAAFKATYSDWKLVKTRGVVQVIFEVPLAEADLAYQVVGGMPDAAAEKWFAVARLREEVVPDAKRGQSIRTPDTPAAPSTPAQTARPGKSWHEMGPAQQVGILCNEQSFWKFLGEDFHDIHGELAAVEFVRNYCGVTSRADIATNRDAKIRWDRLVGDYRAWMREPELVG